MADTKPGYVFQVTIEDKASGYAKAIRANVVKELAGDIGIAGAQKAIASLEALSSTIAGRTEDWKKLVKGAKSVNVALSSVADAAEASAARIRVAYQGVFDPLIVGAKAMADELVNHSIIPDMAARIYAELVSVKKFMRTVFAEGMSPETAKGLRDYEAELHRIVTIHQDLAKFIGKQVQTSPVAANLNKFVAGKSKYGTTDPEAFGTYSSGSPWVGYEPSVNLASGFNSQGGALHSFTQMVATFAHEVLGHGLQDMVTRGMDEAQTDEIIKEGIGALAPQMAEFMVKYESDLTTAFFETWARTASEYFMNPQDVSADAAAFLTKMNKRGAAVDPYKQMEEYPSPRFQSGGYDYRSSGLQTAEWAANALELQKLEGRIPQSLAASYEKVKAELEKIAKEFPSSMAEAEQEVAAIDVFASVTANAQQMSDEIVGHSIVPEMVGAVIEEITRMKQFIDSALAQGIPEESLGTLREQVDILEDLQKRYQALVALAEKVKSTLPIGDLLDKFISTTRYGGISATALGNYYPTTQPEVQVNSVQSLPKTGELLPLRIGSLVTTYLHEVLGHGVQDVIGRTLNKEETDRLIDEGVKALAPQMVEWSQHLQSTITNTFIETWADQAAKFYKAKFTTNPQLYSQMAPKVAGFLQEAERSISPSELDIDPEELKKYSSFFMGRVAPISQRASPVGPDTVLAELKQAYAQAEAMGWPDIGKDAFQALIDAAQHAYDEIVGHSSIPDLVTKVIWWMGTLNKDMIATNPFLAFEEAAKKAGVQVTDVMAKIAEMVKLRSQSMGPVGPQILQTGLEAGRPGTTSASEEQTAKWNLAASAALLKLLGSFKAQEQIGGTAPESVQTANAAAVHDFASSLARVASEVRKADPAAFKLAATINEVAKAAGRTTQAERTRKMQVSEVPDNIRKAVIELGKFSDTDLMVRPAESLTLACKNAGIGVKEFIRYLAEATALLPGQPGRRSSLVGRQANLMAGLVTVDPLQTRLQKREAIEGHATHIGASLLELKGVGGVDRGLMSPAALVELKAKLLQVAGALKSVANETYYTKESTNQAAIIEAGAQKVRADVPPSLDKIRISVEQLSEEMAKTGDLGPFGDPEHVRVGVNAMAAYAEQVGMSNYENMRALSEKEITLVSEGMRRIMVEWDNLTIGAREKDPMKWFLESIREANLRLPDVLKYLGKITNAGPAQQRVINLGVIGAGAGVLPPNYQKQVDKAIFQFLQKYLEAWPAKALMQSRPGTLADALVPGVQLQPWQNTDIALASGALAEQFASVGRSMANSIVPTEESVKAGYALIEERKVDAEMTTKGVVALAAAVAIDQKRADVSAKATAAVAAEIAAKEANPFDAEQLAIQAQIQAKLDEVKARAASEGVKQQNELITISAEKKRVIKDETDQEAALLVQQKALAKELSAVTAAHERAAAALEKEFAAASKAGKLPTTAQIAAKAPFTQRSAEIVAAREAQEPERTAITRELETILSEKGKDRSELVASEKELADRLAALDAHIAELTKTQGAGAAQVALEGQGVERLDIWTKQGDLERVRAGLAAEQIERQKDLIARLDALNQEQKTLWAELGKDIAAAQAAGTVPTGEQADVLAALEDKRRIEEEGFLRKREQGAAKMQALMDAEEANKQESVRKVVALDQQAIAAKQALDDATKVVTSAEASLPPVQGAVTAATVQQVGADRRLASASTNAAAAVDDLGKTVHPAVQGMIDADIRARRQGATIEKEARGPTIPNVTMPDPLRYPYRIQAIEAGTKAMRTNQQVAMSLATKIDVLSQAINVGTMKYFGLRRAGYALAESGRVLERWGSGIIKSLSDMGKEYAELSEVATRAAAAISLPSEKMPMLEQAIKDTAQTLGLFKPAEVAEGLRIWGAGIGAVVTNQEDLNRIMAQSTQIQMLAAMNNAALAGTTTQVGGAISEFGLTMADTERVVSIFNYTAAKTFASLDDVGDSFRMVGPLAKTLGLSIEETAVAFGILANANIRGTMAGRAMRQMLLLLTDHTKEYDDAMNRALGYTGMMQDQWKDIVFPGGEFIGLAKYIDLLTAATERYTQAEKVAFFSTIATTSEVPALVTLTDLQTKARERGINAIRAWTDIQKGVTTRETGQFKVLMEEVTKTTFSMENAYKLFGEMSNKYAQSTQTATKRMETAWSNARTSIGEAWQKLMLPTLTAAAEAVESLSKIVQRVPALATLAGVIGGGAAIIGALLSVAGVLAGFASNYLILKIAAGEYAAATATFMQAVLMFSASQGIEGKIPVPGDQSLKKLLTGLVEGTWIVSVGKTVASAAIVAAKVAIPALLVYVGGMVAARTVMPKEMKAKNPYLGNREDAGLAPLVGKPFALGKDILALSFAAVNLQVMNLATLIGVSDEATKRFGHSAYNAAIAMSSAVTQAKLLGNWQTQNAQEAARWRELYDPYGMNSGIMATPKRGLSSEEVEALKRFDELQKAIVERRKEAVDALNELDKQYFEQWEQTDKEYYDRLAQLDADYQEQKYEAWNALLDKMAEMRENYGDKLIDIEQSYQDKLADIAEGYQEKLADISAGYNEKMADIDQKNVEAREKIMEEYYKNLKRMAEDHNDSLDDLIRERDARGILKEMQRYEKERRRAEEDKDERLAEQEKAAQKEREEAAKEAEKARQEAAKDRDRAYADAAKDREKAREEARKDLEKALADARKQWEKEQQERDNALAKQKEKEAAAHEKMEAEQKEAYDKEYAALNQKLKDDVKRLQDAAADEIAELRKSNDQKKIEMQAYYDELNNKLEDFLKRRAALLAAYGVNPEDPLFGKTGEYKLPEPAPLPAPVGLGFSRSSSEVLANQLMSMMVSGQIARSGGSRGGVSVEVRQVDWRFQGSFTNADKEWFRREARDAAYAAMDDVLTEVIK